jgi:DNA polymerase III alpha subunit
MVYQEDVMKIVYHFAGLDLDESDVLRRIMTGKKYKGDTFEKLRKKYFDNCRRRGYPGELIREVWRQIESFSGYSFCKAHSASFAVESFQSLYLKAYFPLEFMVAVINNFGGFYRTEYYVHEARLCGATIHAPCVNHSQFLTTIKGKDIYLGFVHLQGMERLVAHRIVTQRARAPFRDLADFVSRVDISSEQLELLIRIGAFRFTGMNKYELMWEKVAVFNPKDHFDGTLSLFDQEQMPEVGSRKSEVGNEEEEEIINDHNDIIKNLRTPNASLGKPSPSEQALDQIELLGFPLCSPFELIDATHCHDCIRVRDLPHFNGRIVKILGYYVCQKPVRTVQGKLMAFGTWLDKDGAYFDTTHFPGFLKRFPFRGKGVYKIEGKVAEEYGYYSVEVIRMERLPSIPPKGGSRTE